MTRENGHQLDGSVEPDDAALAAAEEHLEQSDEERAGSSGEYSGGSGSDANEDDGEEDEAEPSTPPPPIELPDRSTRGLKKHVCSWAQSHAAGRGTNSASQAACLMSQSCKPLQRLARSSELRRDLANIAGTAFSRTIFLGMSAVNFCEPAHKLLDPFVILLLCP